MFCPPRFSSRSLRGRSQGVMSVAILAAVAGWTLVGGAQTMPATGPTMVMTAPPVAATMPAAVSAPAAAPGATAVIPPAPTLPAPPAPTSTVIAPPPGAPTAELPAVTQPFVATITADKVYVRSGADTKYYEMGQLTKGDLVYVVGTSAGWYKILPPNGTYCMIAKEYVEMDNGAATGTVKGDYINVRAGSAAYKDREPSAVLTTVRKGTKLKILGATDKYYEVAPPEKAYVFVSPQFLKAAAGTEYKVATLKLPAGVTGPTGVTVEAPTTLPTVAVGVPEPVVGIVPPVVGGTPAVSEPVAQKPTPVPVQTPLPPLVPTVKFSETATAKFNDVNAKYQEEVKKAPLQQEVDGLLKDFKEILAMENVSPSVKAGAEADITAIERTMTVQRLMKEQTAATEQTQKQSDALREQYDAAEKAIEASREVGPYSAQGVLQTSTIVTGKYALVNPQTGRVVAYVDPSTASVDIGSLVGKYIGVRGISKRMEGADITVIQVSNATLMPQPK